MNSHLLYDPKYFPVMHHMRKVEDHMKILTKIESWLNKLVLDSFSGRATVKDIDTILLSIKVLNEKIMKEQETLIIYYN